MYRKICIFLVFWIFIISCHHTLKENNNSFEKPRNPKETLNLTYGKSTKDFLKISKQELQEQVSKSKIGRMIIFEHGKTLDFSSDGSLTYFLFGNDYSVEGFQKHFGNIFKIDTQKISSEIHSTEQLVFKLTYNFSFIKVYYNPELKRNDIISGKILDKEIYFFNNLKIGVSKIDFFSAIFENANDYNFANIDTINNGDELGEIQQCFIFKNDTLREVILKSEYDWIPFELE